MDAKSLVERDATVGSEAGCWGWAAMLRSEGGRGSRVVSKKEAKEWREGNGRCAVATRLEGAACGPRSVRFEIFGLVTGKDWVRSG